MTMITTQGCLPPIFNIPAQFLLKNQTARKTVYVYQDEGASKQSVQHTLYSLTQLLGDAYAVKTLDASAVCLGQWQKDAALFVMPGGADLPYVKKLSGRGNAIIKDYVRQGGAYLGICAGAYYAAETCEFHKGHPELEVVGKRELAFYPGVAKGPMYGPYRYQDSGSARAVNIQVFDQPKPLTVYYNGGSYFEPEATMAGQPSTVLAWYKNKEGLPEKPAIVSRAYGEGKVVLSGVHFEYSDELLAEKTEDPYLTRITPALKASHAERAAFFKQILVILGLTLNAPAR